jgi:hypothetical protein
MRGLELKRHQHSFAGEGAAFSGGYAAIDRNNANV